MANNPKKITDPTDDAMTAIQQVLNVSDDAIDTRPAEPAAAPVESIEAALEREAPKPVRTPEREPYEPASAAREEHVATIAHDEPVRPQQFAANDDRQSIGQILQLLQQRPPRTSYLVASIFTLAWVAG